MEGHPMTNFVEATNSHHHYVWQATHASEGDAVYMEEEEEIGSNGHEYHDEIDHNDQDCEFRVESADPGVHSENEEHFLDNSLDDTEAFFGSYHHPIGGGGGRHGGGPMCLPSSGRIER